MANPFQTMAGPAITPKTTPGGGDARPPYLQMRTPGMPVQGNPNYYNQNFFQRNGFGSRPVVTPKSTAVPGEVASQPRQGIPLPAIGANPTGKPATPPQAGGNSLNDLYGFFKSDLQNQTNQALANTRSDAAARGVFYGTPLTGSEADINTQYLRGLGQLQSGMFQNQQQDQLARLQLATQLYGFGAQGQPSAPGPLDLSGLASLFGQSPAVSPRQGPTKSPTLTKTGDKIQPKTQIN